MRIPKQRILFWTLLGALLLLVLLAAFWPRPVLTDIAEAKTGPMRATIQEEGETRVPDIYTLSSPITGYLRRIDLEVGDQVLAGETVVAEIEPLDSGFLDPRTEAQARAEISTAESALQLAEAELKQAEVELDFARSELARIERLRRTDSSSARDLDNAQRQHKSRRAAFATAQAALQMRRFELQRAQALLMSPNESRELRTACECMRLKAPISGTVLQVITESEGVVQAGNSLVEIGDPSKLEVVADLLSRDAVKVSVGDDVLIENWGGSRALTGQVKRIDPVGITRVSALGIEEQRVNVVIDLTSPSGEWQRLGHGYQVDVAVILWQQEEVLQVPLTALFRQGESWAIYRVENGIARSQTLELGHRSSRSAEVLSGLQPGDPFVVYPSDKISDGVRVVSR